MSLKYEPSSEPLRISVVSTRVRRWIQPSMSLQYEPSSEPLRISVVSTRVRARPLTPTLLLFFFTLVTGPRRSLSLKLRDTRVYEP